MRPQESECQISQHDTLHKIFRILQGDFICVFTILAIVKFDIYFLRLPWKIVFGVITDNQLYP